MITAKNGEVREVTDDADGERCVCGSARIASISAKCSDRCAVQVGDEDHDGYAPSDMGIGGGGDYICFAWCLDCGRIQPDEGESFPLPKCNLEKPLEERE